MGFRENFAQFMSQGREETQKEIPKRSQSPFTPLTRQGVGGQQQAQRQSQRQQTPDFSERFRSFITQGVEDVQKRLPDQAIRSNFGKRLGEIAGRIPQAPIDIRNIPKPPKFLQGQKEFAKEVPKGIGKFALDAFVRAPVRAAASGLASEAESGLNLASKITGKKELDDIEVRWDPKRFGFMGKVLMGDRVIDDISTEGEKILKDIGTSEKTAKRFGPEVGFIFAGLDLVPITSGASKKAALKGMEKIAKSQDIPEIVKIARTFMKGSDEAIEDLAVVLRNENTKEGVQSIITRAKLAERAETAINTGRSLDDFVENVKVDDLVDIAQGSTISKADDLEKVANDVREEAKSIFKTLEDTAKKASAKVDEIPMSEKKFLEEARKLEDKALNTFYETKKPQESLFITSDGKFIDGTGKNKVPKSNWKYMNDKIVDHREVASEVLDSNGSDALIEYMNKTGNVRMSIHGDKLNLDIVKPLNPKQLQAIETAFKTKGVKKIIADISDNTGGVLKSGEFNSLEGYKKFVDTNLPKTDIFNKAKKVDIEAKVPKKTVKTGAEQLKEREALKLAREEAKAKKESLQFFDEELESQYQQFKSLVTPGKLDEIEDATQFKQKVKAAPEEVDGILYSQNKTESEVFDMFKDRRFAEAEPLPVVPKETKAVVAEKARRKIKSAKDILDNRRERVRLLQKVHGLTDGELKKVSNKDIRLMKNWEFKQFIDKAEQRAVELADTRQAKNELMQVLRDKEFKREESYRTMVAKLPRSIDEMTPQQMREYVETLEQFEDGTEFLTKRDYEVLPKTRMKGIKTMQEARVKLAKYVKETTGRNVTASDFNNVTAGDLDVFRGDVGLMETNPIYEYPVRRTQEAIMQSEMAFFEIEDKVQELAKAANKSRKRGVVGTIKHKLIPQHKEMVGYLEAPVEMKREAAKFLTKEELDYVNYVEQYFANAYDHLIKIKELYGSNFVDEYFPHTRKRFLEKWSDDGIIESVKNFWSSQKEAKEVSMIMDQDTGNILPKSKFFSHVMQRTGELDPSQNLTRTFTNYARAFEKKKLLDEIIPELDFYTQLLEPKALTPHGKKLDESFRKVINQYINNKKGRKTSLGPLLKQNGTVDMGIRLANTLTSIKYIAGNVYTAVSAVVGEQIATMQTLGYEKYVTAWKRRVWDTGVKRLASKEGKSILKEAEPFIGRNIWTDIAHADQGFGETLWKTIYATFSQSSVEANKIMLLGSLSKEELQAGKLSAKRLSDIKLEAARYRDMGKEMKSIVGSTSLGEASTKFRGWALPILGTTYRNAKRLVKRQQTGKAWTSKEAKELFTMFTNTAAVLTLGSWLVSEADDDTFIGKMRARVYKETLTLLGAIDPATFMGVPPLADDIARFGKNVSTLFKLEKYEQSGRGYRAGELKGLKGLKRQFTPSAIKQFVKPKTIAEEIYKQLNSSKTREEKKEILETYLQSGELTDNVAKKIQDLKTEDVAKDILKELDKTGSSEEKKALLVEYAKSGKLTDDVADIISQELTDKKTGISNKEKEIRDGTTAQKTRYIKKKMDKAGSLEEKKEVLKDLAIKGILTDNVADEVSKLIKMSE